MVIMMVQERRWMSDCCVLETAINERASLVLVRLALAQLELDRRAATVRL